MISKNKCQKAFTLIELLIVIAIIGILAGVLITALSSQRTKAYNANALTALESVKSAAYACVSGGTALAFTTGAPVAGNNVCAGATETWPTLPTGWAYTGSGVSDATAATFTYNAAGTGSATVQCKETGCTKSGF